jgi:UDP-N-acetylmuramate dehydrogenase
MLVRENVPLSTHTTLRLGGPASRMVVLESEEDVADIAADAKASGEPLFILGDGSNIVVGDEGFAGLVAKVALRGTAVQRQDSRVLVDVAAGEDWDALVARAADEGWRGIECLSGIPGRVGATPIQNVGAYGWEISQWLTSVRAFDRSCGQFVTMRPSECGLGYRTSVFKRNDRWIVTRVTFAFDQGHESLPVRYAELARALSVAEGARAPLSRVREAVLGLRRSKGMVVHREDPDSVSVGSFFVNPVLYPSEFGQLEKRAGERPPSFDAGGGALKVAAAWLVERAGFVKGFALGRAGISRKHALALINLGGATAREVLALAHAVRDGVWERFGVELEPEPVLVGCSWERKSA